MSRVADELDALWPALTFLLAAVPLAALLDDLGFFEAVAERVSRPGGRTPVLALWVLAAATTIVLNLDTTIVLLTPLYVRIAQRARVDPTPLAVIPLLLASLASSVLPVSNLTTLVAVEQLHLTVADVVTHLALPSLAASTVAWFLYRRRHPAWVVRDPAVPAALDPVAGRRALRIGGLVVAGALVGFTLGAEVGIHAWIVAVAADVALVAVTRAFPWRRIPVATAAAVAVVGTVAVLVVPAVWFRDLFAHTSPPALLAITGLATAAANAVNNLPALVVSIQGAHRVTWATWAWLLGVNTGAVLLPIGALANILWRRIVAPHDIARGLRDYVALTAPIALPALLVSALVLAAERLL